MKSTAADSLLNKIDQSISDISAFPGLSALESSYLAKYLVVFSCGIYEEVIETIINEKTSQLNSAQINKYVESSVGRFFRNPCIENIKELLKKFDVAWVRAVDQQPQSAKDALDSVVDNKNALAHGTACNITLSEALDYLKKSRTVIEAIDDAVL